MSDLIVQAFAVIDTNVIISSMIGDNNYTKSCCLYNALSE